MRELLLGEIAETTFQILSLSHLCEKFRGLNDHSWLKSLLQGRPNDDAQKLSQFFGISGLLEKNVHTEHDLITIPHPLGQVSLRDSLTESVEIPNDRHT